MTVHLGQGAEGAQRAGATETGARPEAPARAPGPAWGGRDQRGRIWRNERIDEMKMLKTGGPEMGEMEHMRSATSATLVNPLPPLMGAGRELLVVAEDESDARSAWAPNRVSFQGEEN